MEEKIEELIQIMKEKGFLTNGKVEDAIRKTPRIFFVPKQYKEEAYDDRPIETKKYANHFAAISSSLHDRMVRY